MRKRVRQVMCMVLSVAMVLTMTPHMAFAAESASAEQTEDAALQETPTESEDAASKDGAGDKAADGLEETASENTVSDDIVSEDEVSEKTVFKEDADIENVGDGLTFATGAEDDWYKYYSYDLVKSGGTKTYDWMSSDKNYTRIIHDNSSSSGLRRIVTVFLILFAFT